jgi:DNA polymerase III subunit delta'
VDGSTRARPRRVDTTPGSGWPEWADVGALRTLRAAATGRPAHAYLLSGPGGVGKSALALAFAKAVCCPHRGPGPDAEPCGTCASCRAIDRGGHPDIANFSLATQAALADKPARGANLSIETVRRLRSSASLLPYQSDRRIAIVEDAETMLEPAQQALLKILEEPPPAVTILLLADEPESLLSTVRSRCQDVRVRPVSEDRVRQALVEQGVEERAASEIAALSMGRPGWAVAAVADSKLLQARREAWEAAAEWVEAAPYERLVTAFRLGDQFTKRRVGVIGTVQAAIAILRGQMLAGVRGNGEGFDGGAEQGSPLALGRAIAASLQCLADLEANVRPRLALEAMVLSWPNPEYRQN